MLYSVHLQSGQVVPVLPFFNLVMVWNPGNFLRPVPGVRTAGNFPADWPVGGGGDRAELASVARHQPFAGHRLWPDHRGRSGNIWWTG